MKGIRVRVSPLYIYTFQTVAHHAAMSTSFFNVSGEMDAGMLRLPQL
jgi:hypothetical protein